MRIKAGALTLAILGLLVPVAVHARPMVLLFPSGTSAEVFASGALDNPREFFYAQPKCDGEKVLPCRMRPRVGRVLWTGTPTGDGYCTDVPDILIIIPKSGRVAFKVTKTCRVRFVRVDRARFSPDVEPLAARVHRWDGARFAQDELQ